MDSQDDDFFTSSFTQSISLQTCNSLNESLENNEKSDSLNYLSSDADEKILVSTLAAVSENKAGSNKSSQKRMASWTKKFFDTYRLEKKRKCNILVSSSKGKIKCSHSFNIQTATSNLASHLHTVHQ
ncbi:20608_t:CDS:1, partial [Gigaspora margarita]